ncbi:MAG: (d)CMP kinase [Nitrospirae bacterium]|nr:(d)CMP kinase [Nitrospirota bacterium]
MKDIITIDGPSGAGKSTVSKLLAQRLGYSYLDTGALYRAVAWKVKKEGIDPDNEEKLKEALSIIKITLESGKVIVNGVDVSSDIRTGEIGEMSSKVSAKPVVREYLYAIQREIGLKGRVVVEGRDIGTVIFPESENKFFFDASPEERGKRRHKELSVKNSDTSIKDTIEDLKKRDTRDSTRDSAPLKRANDMIYIDTTNIGIDGVVEKIISELKRD